MRFKDIEADFPELNFFVVRGAWNDKFGHRDFKYTNYEIRIFCSIESSLGIKKISPYLTKGSQSLKAIEIYDRLTHGPIEYNCHIPGIAFAESGKIYLDLEDLKRDCLIVSLSGIKQ